VGDYNGVNKAYENFITKVKTVLESMLEFPGALTTKINSLIDSIALELLSEDDSVETTCYDSNIDSLLMYFKNNIKDFMSLMANENLHRITRKLRYLGYPVEKIKERQRKVILKFLRHLDTKNTVNKKLEKLLCYEKDHDF
jgi:hypothetical protein